MIRDLKYPLDFFGLMIPDSILEEIVRQTNLRAITSTKIKSINVGFLATRFPRNKDIFKPYTCHGTKPAIEDYWSTSWPFTSSTFSSIVKMTSQVLTSER